VSKIKYFVLLHFELHLPECLVPSVTKSICFTFTHVQLCKYIPVLKQVFTKK